MKVVGRVSDSCSLCRFSVGRVSLGFVFELLFPLLLVLSACSAIGCLFTVSIVLWQVWNRALLLLLLVRVVHRNLAWQRLTLAVLR